MRAPTERVLVVLAHPDDPEFYCGATIARWCDEGRETVYCLLTRGEKGTDDPAADLGPMFRQVIGTMFNLMGRYEMRWKAARGRG